MSEKTILRRTLADEAATLDLGRALAERAAAGDVFALTGDLGVGKTVLARGFIRHLAGYREDVPSPTFTLVQVYPCEKVTIWHFDLYRLTGPDEALELGIEDAFYDGISLIEWPERLAGALPASRLRVHLETVGEGRVVTLSGDSPWAERLKGLTP